MHHVLVAVRMLRAPEGTPPHTVAWAGLRNNTPNFMTKANLLLGDLGTDLLSIYDRPKQGGILVVKRIFKQKAAEWWKAEVKSNRRLRLTYTPQTPFELRGYLSEHFPGRRLLTKLRLDDLPLRAAGVTPFRGSEGTCPLCHSAKETGVHFTIVCSALGQVREEHMDPLPLLSFQKLSPVDRYQMITLNRPRGACNDLELAKKVGLRTKRRIPFYNGKIECRLLEYELY